MTRFLGLTSADALRITNRRRRVRRWWAQLDIFDLFHGGGWR